MCACVRVCVFVCVVSVFVSACMHACECVPMWLSTCMRALCPLPLSSLSWRDGCSQENVRENTDLISPKTLPSWSVAKTTLLLGPPTTSTRPVITMYISRPTSPCNRHIASVGKCQKYHQSCHIVGIILANGFNVV